MHGFVRELLQREMSSTIQMLRPCVPTIRSFSRGCTSRSSIRTVGRPAENRFHSRPAFIETKSPNSVQRTAFGLRVSSSMTLTLPAAGRLPEIDVHVCP